MHQTGIVQQAMFDYHGAWGLKSEIGELSLPKIGMQDDWAYVSHFSHINGIDNRYVFKDIKDHSVGDAMIYSEFLRSSYYMLSDFFALCTFWANFMFRTPPSDIQHWRYWSRFVR